MLFSSTFSLSFCTLFLIHDTFDSSLKMHFVKDSLKDRFGFEAFEKWAFKESTEFSGFVKKIQVLKIIHSYQFIRVFGDHW